MIQIVDTQVSAVSNYFSVSFINCVTIEISSFNQYLVTYISQVQVFFSNSEVPILSYSCSNSHSTKVYLVESRFMVTAIIY